MIKHSKSVSSAHQRKFGPIERIKITFAFAANTIRRTLFHPILLLWILIVASLSVFALFHFDTIVADTTNNTGLLRDVTLIIAALFALPLALSRTLTSERALLNERYQKASEMLGSEISMVRLAAVYALKRLSHERSEDYHVDVVKLLCSFVRMRTAKEKSKNGTPVPPGKPDDDVQEALTYLKGRGGQLRAIEDSQNLKQIDLSNSRLIGFDLSNGDMSDTIFADAVLDDSDLSHTNLSNCSLVNCSLNETKISAAHLRLISGLSQRALDNAIADDGFAPELGSDEEVPIDPDTNRKLVWK